MAQHVTVSIHVPRWRIMVARAFVGLVIVYATVLHRTVDEDRVAKALAEFVVRGARVKA